MLKGISPLISPDLLKYMHEMGHGDDIVFADAHFPGRSLTDRVLRADGLPIAPLLDAIAPLLVVEELVMMETATPAQLDPAIESEYLNAIRGHAPGAPSPSRLERFAFYARAARSFCIVMTGELRPYGNILLRKGVTL